jgi:hypothetical protein|tara:strand:+ start:1330 stop:2178 length:849 start_codon:yes stop_codon:yes gene_type:complete
MKKIFLTLLLFSNLFAQANNLLTISPSAHTSSIGNVTLPMMSPARNHIDNDKFTFTRVNWLGNIVDDMNYMHFNLARGSFDVYALIFNYGQQLETDISGVVTGRFSPMSSVWGVSWGTVIKGYNVGVTGKVLSHDLYTQKTHGTAFDVATYLPKVYKDLDVDVAIKNFGFAPTFGTYKTKLPTSLNVAMTYPYKQWMFYEQHNIYNGHVTSGMGASYKYEVKNQATILAKAGYYSDKSHELSYPTFGVDLKYDKYFIGMSYIYGDQTLPVSNTFRLTINLEL